MRGVISWIKSFLPGRHYTYGTVEFIGGSRSKSGSHRLNNRTGRMEFILWYKDKDRDEDVWYCCGSHRVEHFTPDETR